jgi:DNA-binding CsgD family transcriptional regulator
MLSARETDVLRLVARGGSSKQIGRRLKISEAGVNFHILNAMKKLKASTRAHAAAKAVALGILSRADVLDDPEPADFEA